MNDEPDLMTQLLADAQARIAELEGERDGHRQQHALAECEARKIAETERDEALVEAKAFMDVIGETQCKLDDARDLLRSASHYVRSFHDDAGSEALWIQSGELHKKILAALTPPQPIRATEPGPAGRTDIPTPDGLYVNSSKTTGTVSMRIVPRKRRSSGVDDTTGHD